VGVSVFGEGRKGDDQRDDESHRATQQQQQQQPATTDQHTHQLAARATTYPRRSPLRCLWEPTRDSGVLGVVASTSFRHPPRDRIRATARPALKGCQATMHACIRVGLLWSNLNARQLITDCVRIMQLRNG